MHPLLTSSSAVFQAGGLVVVLIEVGRKAYLASLVPVIVNAILNEHQIIVDIVAFVNKGDFPRSRLGEKQRGKILASWVSRKMRTMAQFAIRDMDAAALAAVGGGEGDGTNASDANRASLGSLRNSGGLGVVPGNSSSLRNMEPAPQILEQRELEQQLESMAALPPRAQIAEMPGDEQAPSSRGRDSYGVPASINNAYNPPGSAGGNGSINDLTPTKPRITSGTPSHGFDLPDFNQFDDDDRRPPVGPKPGSAGGQHLNAPQIRLPAVDGRESMDWTREGTTGNPDEDWTADAMMQMNLAARND